MMSFVEKVGRFMMRKERGQAIILVVFAMVALLALVGLAIDGGRLYSARRRTQNAADAAAIAGTRELAQVIMSCGSGTGAQDEAVANAVSEFARQNGVSVFPPDGFLTAWYVDQEENRLGRVYAGAIPNGATGVEVTQVVTDPTTFLKVLGMQDYTAGANAMAMTGPIQNLGNGSGMLPIAVPEFVVGGLAPGEVFEVFDDTGVFCRENDGYCFMGDGGPSAQRAWLNMSHIYNAAYWNTDLDRAFVKNVGTAGCKYNPDGTVDAGATGLKGWASGQCPYPHPLFAGGYGALNGDFVHGSPGVSKSALRELDNNYDVGDIVTVPIFDFVYDPGTMDANFPGKEPAVGWATGGGGTSAYYYHIVGFAAVRLSEIVVTPKGKIEGAFLEMVVGEGEINPSAGVGSCSDNSTLFGVTLWK
jgi:hypothetical protein